MTETPEAKSDESVQEKSADESGKTPAEAIRDLLVEEDPRPSDVDEASGEAVRRVLADAFASSGADGAEDAVAEAMKGAIDAAKKLDAAIWHVARGAVFGALVATRGTTVDTRALIRTATRALMLAADSFGGDFGAAAKGAVEGAIHGAWELGLDDGDSGSLAATAAFETATKELPRGAPERIRAIVGRPVQGIQVEIRA